MKEEEQGIRRRNESENRETTKDITIGTNYLELINTNNNNSNLLPEWFNLTGIQQQQQNQLLQQQQQQQVQQHHHHHQLLQQQGQSPHTITNQKIYTGGNMLYGNVGGLMNRPTIGQQQQPPYNYSNTNMEIDNNKEENNKKRRKPYHVKRACMACKKAHAGCDQERPCSRCTKKGIECVEQPSQSIKRKRRRRKKIGEQSSEAMTESEESIYESNPNTAQTIKNHMTKDIFLMNTMRMKLQKLENDTEDLKKMMKLLLTNMGVPLPREAENEPRMAAGLDLSDPSKLALINHASRTMIGSSSLKPSSVDDVTNKNTYISPYIGPWSEWANDFHVGIAVFSKESNVLLTCNNAFATQQDRPQSELLGMHFSKFETPPELESLLPQSETRTVTFKGTNPTTVVIDQDVWWMRVTYH